MNQEEIDQLKIQIVETHQKLTDMNLQWVLHLDMFIKQKEKEIAEARAIPVKLKGKRKKKEGDTDTVSSPSLFLDMQSQTKCCGRQLMKVITD